MFKSFYEKLNFLEIEKEFDFPKPSNRNIFNVTNDEETDDSNLFKVPKYLERVKF